MQPNKFKSDQILFSNRIKAALHLTRITISKAQKFRVFLPLSFCVIPVKFKINQMIKQKDN